jgi:hypothetical protein
LINRTTLFAISMVISLCSCSAAGKSVRIIENSRDYECEFLGTVSSIDTFGSNVSDDPGNALHETREKAAQLGANTIKIISMRTTFQGTSVTAEALSCTFPEDDREN